MGKDSNKSSWSDYMPDYTKATDALPKPKGIRLAFHQSTSVQISLASTLIFGRNSEGSPVDVDLSIFNAVDLGVSRQHITLTTKSNRIYVKDMGSRNGTRISDMALESGKFYELRDGDSLQLGKLEMNVQFIYEDFDESVIPTELPQKAKSLDETTYNVRPFSNEEFQKGLSHRLDE